MTDKAVIQAQLVDVRNVGFNKSVKLTLHVPAEQAHLVMSAFGWPTMIDPVPVAVARLDLKKVAGPLFDDGMQQATTEPKAKAPRRPVAPEKRLAQRSAILCGDLPFRKFLEGEVNQPIMDEATAADVLRKLCGVTSRSELVVGTEEGDRFEQLLGRYAAWGACIE